VSSFTYTIGIPLQMMTNKGSKIWEMIYVHLRLRYTVLEMIIYLNFILIVAVFAGTKPSLNLLSSNGWLLFRCRVPYKVGKLAI
jgi:hypothetical protein